MIVYIDESGDLGWTFTKPFRRGGSSRYLTISFLLVPNELKHHPKRIIKNVYTKYKIPTTTEIKGSKLSVTQKTYFSNQVIQLLQSHPQIRIISITVNKQRVAEHIRRDGNKIYNYMIGLALLDEIKTEDRVTLMPDPRNIKVESGNSLIEYLQIKLWFELTSTTVLDIKRVSSDKSDNLKFIDIITHILWDGHENRNMICANILAPYIHTKRLFFS